MSELFDDDNDKVMIVEDEIAIHTEKLIVENSDRPISDARRRLETLMEEKRLRDELEDFPDI